MFITYCIIAFVSLIVLSFLAGVTGFAEEWNKDIERHPSSSAPPAGVLVFFAAVFWPISSVGLLVTSVICGGQWLRRRIKEELEDVRTGE